MGLGSKALILTSLTQSPSEQKIGFFGQFIGEKSVFGWHGNDFDKIKSEEKKSAKIGDFSPKNPIFSLFFLFVP